MLWHQEDTAVFGHADEVCNLFTLHFSRRISIVTAVRFVIVDFKEMNE